MRSRHFLPLIWLAGAVALVGGSANALELPFQQTKLANGLTVIVHEDHLLPEVATNLLYRVGSKDEKAGRTGFAHLFEHLMFMGTKRAPNKMFDAWMEAAGGQNNASTSSDVTDYFESGPSALLPLFVWLEADRLDALGGEIDKPKLDLQRDVVRNERRQMTENRPYGKVELRLPELLYPESHPYHHPVIGSHADLEAASVEDVRSFFNEHYAPENAALVVAGDVRAADVNDLAERYFGVIPSRRRSAPASRVDKKAAPLPTLDKVVRETLEDRVEMTKIIMAFHSPARFDPGDAELDLLASVLSSGKTSRLYKSLVYEKALAQSVTASQDSSALSSVFTIEILVRPGVSADAVEKATDAILAQVLAKAPTDEEVRRAKNQVQFQFVDRLQSVAARARLLNVYWSDLGDPGYVNKDLARYEQATAEGILGQAKKTITLGGRVVVRVVPRAS
ncbi:MAG TPA: pitrilysin family protein [Polyangiaceae bacterium]|nr:pitrilysin family protein [Polyangiaceae bacterium]